MQQNVTPPHASSVINLSANDDSYYWDISGEDELRNRTRSYFIEDYSSIDNHERMRILTSPNRFNDYENDFGKENKSIRFF